ncbi:DUF935 family protein [Pseudarthrobacter sp. W1I19]|uniref:phage portal protein family protein n=1 Tax=Pseudarthrobacter sp. W1I19 TaxID=3042288 RepID=UPI0027D7A2CF|nr:DUF935 family protein [Pseudarthrobacter sp. W1I19]
MDEANKSIEAAAKKSTAQYRELGESGTLVFSGIITGEEYSPDLMGHKAAVVYDRMRRSDATVRSSLQAVFLPIMQAEWTFEAASEDAADVEMAEFCNENFFTILDWHGFLSEALTYLPFGYAVFEMVLELRPVNGKERIVLSKLAFRKQKSIYRWSSDKFGAGITQMLANGDSPETPLEKLVIFTNQKEGENYEGISVLRSSYQNWFIKSALYQIDSVAHERHGLGVIDIVEPAQADDTDRQMLIRAARALRANEQSYINHKAGWDIGFMDMKSQTLRDMMPSINHHDRQISKNVLAQFLELGASSGSGSRSLSEDLTSFFTLAEKATAQTIIDTLARTAIKTLVDLNFTTDKYPKLKANGLDDEALPVFSEALSKLSAAGAITMDDDIENRSRAAIGVKPLPKDHVREKPAAKPNPENPMDPDSKTNIKDVPDEKAKKKVSAEAKIRKARQLYQELDEALDEQRAA